MLPPIASDRNRGDSGWQGLASVAIRFELPSRRHVLPGRRAEIVEELRLFRLGEATRALREELDERYPVRFHVELARGEPNDGPRP